MNFEFFMARHIIRNKRRSFSRFIVGVATVAVALGMSVMIIAGAMVTGFQKEISRKIFGFWGHLQITSNLHTSAFEDAPMSLHQKFYPYADTIRGVEHIQAYAIKPGILKSKEEIEGIVFKGLGKDFRRAFMKDYLKEGNLFYPSDSLHGNDSILISQATANNLKVKVGEQVTAAIIRGNSYRKQKMIVGGIYNTGLNEYDSKYAMMDIARIQYFNNWNRDSVGGFEIFITDIRDMNSIEQKLNDEYYNIGYSARSLRNNYAFSNIFEWLQLQDVNEQVIIILMILVSIINMVTAILILILERTNMIGLLKSMGSSSGSIRKIFLYNAAWITGRGMLFGNLVGIGICLLQKKSGLIRLPEESYYLRVAPVYLDWHYLLYLNTGTLIICTLVMIVPALLVSRIAPVKAIRFS